MQSSSATKLRLLYVKKRLMAPWSRNQRRGPVPHLPVRRSHFSCDCPAGFFAIPATENLSLQARRQADAGQQRWASRQCGSNLTNHVDSGSAQCVGLNFLFQNNCSCVWDSLGLPIMPDADGTQRWRNIDRRGVWPAALCKQLCKVPSQILSSRYFYCSGSALLLAHSRLPCHRRNRS